MVEKAPRPQTEITTQINLEVKGVVGPWPKADAPLVEIPHQKIELTEIRELLSKQGFELVTAARTTVKDGELTNYYQMPLLDIFSKRLVGHLVCREEVLEPNTFINKK